MPKILFQARLKNTVSYIYKKERSFCIVLFIYPLEYTVL